LNFVIYYRMVHNNANEISMQCTQSRLKEKNRLQILTFTFVNIVLIPPASTNFGNKSYEEINSPKTGSEEVELIQNAIPISFHNSYLTLISIFVILTRKLCEDRYDRHKESCLNNIQQSLFAMQFGSESTLLKYSVKEKCLGCLII